MAMKDFALIAFSVLAIGQGSACFLTFLMFMKDFTLIAFSAIAISQGFACFNPLNVYERFCSYSIQCPCNQSRFGMV